MKRKVLVLVMALCLTLGAASALKDGFEDGDYSSNPTWQDEITNGGSIQVNQQAALNGTYGVQLYNSGSGTENSRTDIYHQFGESLEVGDKFGYWVYVNGTSDYVRVSLEDQPTQNNPSNYIQATLEDDGDAACRTDSAANQLSYDYNANTWYFMSLDVTGTDSIECSIRSQDGSQSDSTTMSVDMSTLTYSEIRLQEKLGSTPVSLYADDATYNTITNQPPQFNSTSVSPEPPEIGNDVNYSAVVYDSDGTVENNTLNVTGLCTYEEYRTGTSPEWNNVCNPSSEGWLNATFTVTDNDGATTTQELDRYLEDTPPNYTVVDPANTTYTTPNVPYQVDFQDDNDSNPDEVGYCEVYNNGNLEDNQTVYETNTTSFSGTFTDLTEGSYTTEVSCTETDDGQTTNKTVEYSVVNGAPNIDNFETQPSTDWTIGDQVDVIYNLTDGFDNITWANVTVDRDGTQVASQNNLYNSDPVDEWLSNFFEVTQVGNYTVKLQAEDEQNQVVTGYVNQSVPDEYPPVTTSNLTESTYYNEEIFVELTANDNASMIANLSYRTNSNDNFTTAQNDSVVFNLTGFKSYNVEYFAWDTAGNKEATQSEIVTLEQLNADFFYNPDTIYTGDTVTFDGGTSSGNITQYEWDFQGDGTYDATGETVDHVFNSPDIYDVTLRVTDNEGNTDTRTQQVEVLFDAPNKTVINQCSDTPFCFEDNSSFTTQNPVSVSGSFTELDSNKSFEWNVNATGSGGSYDFFGFYNSTSSRLNTTEYTDVETVNITTSDVNFPPNPDFTVDFNNLEVSTDASSSTDDGTIESYEWDWTSDGNYEDTGLTSTHTYGSEGEYDITLRVTDNNDTSATTTKTVQVVADDSGGDGTDGGDDGGGGGVSPPADANGASAQLLSPHQGARFTSTSNVVVEEGESTTVTIAGTENTVTVDEVLSQSRAELTVNGVSGVYRERNLFELDLGDAGNWLTWDQQAQISSVVKHNDTGYVQISFLEDEPSKAEPYYAYNYTVNDSATITLQRRETGIGNDWVNVSTTDVTQSVDSAYFSSVETLESDIYSARLFIQSGGNTTTTVSNGFFIGNVPSINITNPTRLQVVERPRTPTKQLPLDYRFAVLEDGVVENVGQYYRGPDGGVFATGGIENIDVESGGGWVEVIRDLLEDYAPSYGFTYNLFVPETKDVYTVESNMDVQGGFGTYTGYVNVTTNRSGVLNTTESLPRNVVVEPTSFEDWVSGETGKVVGNGSTGSENVSTNFGDVDGDGEDEIVGTLKTALIQPEDGSTEKFADFSSAAVDFEFYYANINGSALLNATMVVEKEGDKFYEQDLPPTKNAFNFALNSSQVGDWEKGEYSYHIKYYEPGTNSTVLHTTNGTDAENSFEVKQTGLKDLVSRWIEPVIDGFATVFDFSRSYIGFVIALVASIGWYVGLRSRGRDFLGKAGAATVLGVSWWYGLIPDTVQIILIGVVALTATIKLLRGEITL